MDRKIKGYSLVELLVVIAILAITAGLVVYPLSVHVSRERLRSTMTQLASELNRAKFLSISTGSVWGIRVCSNARQYKIFIDHNMDCEDMSPNCTTVDNVRVCENAPRTQCSSNADCQNNTGPCVQRERLLDLPLGVTSTNDFYVVFDRRGYALNYSCGVGPGEINLRNTFGEQRKVIIDRYGRVRYE